MTGLTFLPTHQRGILLLTKWTPHDNGVASTTALYLCLDNKEENTRLILYQMDARKFRQRKMTLKYVHTESVNIKRLWYQVMSFRKSKTIMLCISYLQNLKNDVVFVRRNIVNSCVCTVVFDPFKGRKRSYLWPVKGQTWSYLWSFKGRKQIYFWDF